MPGPVSRRFFTYHELTTTSEPVGKISVLRSYAANGFFGSGKAYCAIHNDGELELFDEKTVQEFVNCVKRAGMQDTYDPYL